jgi:hypothetical protein
MDADRARGKEMKTTREIQDEILELYGANEALERVMNDLHAQTMEKMKQMFALNQMLKDMEEEEK